MKKIKLDDLQRFCMNALVKSDVSEENARTVTDVLITTDTFGVLTHGTKNLNQYIQKMQAGGLNAKAEPTIEREGLAWAVIDGNKAIGMVSACKAMNLAISKAKEVGIAYVGVRNSCHFGAAGYYANMAAKEGMLGISVSNADPVMAVPNGSGKSIGTNPFSFAAPLGNGRSVFLDIALSNVAALKVVTAQKKDEKIPDSWLVDEDGLPTRDAGKFPQAASLQPMAAHKGYGLAVLVELLASVMTGAGILSEISSWNLDLSSVNNAGHAFIAIDISKIIPKEVFYARVNQMAEELRNAPKAKGADRIYLPGEIEWDRREKVMKSGILELTDEMSDSLQQLSQSTGAALNLIQ